MLLHLFLSMCSHDFKVRKEFFGIFLFISPSSGLLISSGTVRTLSRILTLWSGNFFHNNALIFARCGRSRTVHYICHLQLWLFWLNVIFQGLKHNTVNRLAACCIILIVGVWRNGICLASIRLPLWGMTPQTTVIVTVTTALQDLQNRDKQITWCLTRE